MQEPGVIWTAALGLSGAYVLTYALMYAHYKLTDLDTLTAITTAPFKK